MVSSDSSSSIVGSFSTAIGLSFLSSDVSTVSSSIGAGIGLSNIPNSILIVD
ncbi:6337_t:CDS:2 [Acaulospora morrowiae]|uniref:6337_t:CDS:1 n=1 Tax=Acaulospora morrowiae TaxID=94023 RepID=A0A9N8W7H9_9GLOM|nr:6337_t:CDS:2 [Acaulospora morrowiae]